MGIKIGFIDDVSRTNLKSFVDVIVPLTIEDGDRGSFSRSGGGDLQGIKQSNKASITLQFDRLSQTNLGILRQVMNDRDFIHKTYIHHPADADQQINYTGVVTSPSNLGHSIRRLNETDLTNPDFDVGIEVGLSIYSDISDFTTTVNASATGTNDFAYFYFRFDLDQTESGGSGFLTRTTINEVQRLTLFMFDPRAVDGSGDLGFKIDVQRGNDAASEQWIEIKRQSITTVTANRQFASIRPLEGFTKFSDFLNANNQVTFRMRNLQARTSGTLNVGVKYVELQINGFGCIWTSPDNFTFRDSFTGAGFTGTMELEEL